MCYIVFHELTGINVILMYSSQIFKEMNKDGSSISPKEGVLIQGFVNFGAAILALGTVKILGRKTLLIIGHIGMAIAHIVVAICEINHIDVGVLVNVMIFIAIY